MVISTPLSHYKLYFISVSIPNNLFLLVYLLPSPLNKSNLLIFISLSNFTHFDRLFNFCFFLKPEWLLQPFQWIVMVSNDTNIWGLEGAHYRCKNEGPELTPQRSCQTQMALVILALGRHWGSLGKQLIWICKLHVQWEDVLQRKEIESHCERQLHKLMRTCIHMHTYIHPILSRLSLESSKWGMCAHKSSTKLSPNNNVNIEWLTALC